MEHEAGLQSLWKQTQVLLHDPSHITRALDWIEQIVPVFANACRVSLHHEEEEIFLRWQEWVDGETFEVIGEAGQGDILEWRRQWLQTLLQTTLTLKRAHPAPEEHHRHEWAQHLAQNQSWCSAGFPVAFWSELLAFLSAPARISTAGKNAPIVAAFPLVLSEPIAEGDTSTQVLIGEFVLEPAVGTGSALFLDPQQVALRGMDRLFARTFARAAQVAAQLCGKPAAQLPNVRVQIRMAQPHHERFMLGIPLRGASVGGALALAAYALFSGKRFAQNHLAVSFALGEETDHRCHNVGGMEDKIRGCARQHIRRLLVTTAQRDAFAHYAAPQNVTLLGATDFAQAAALVLRQDNEAAGDKSAELSEGLVPLGSPFYVERAADAEFLKRIEQKQSVLRVKGARQVGKSSLLARGRAHAEQLGGRIVITDFQQLSQDELESPQTFYCAIARILARQLDIPTDLEMVWEDRRGNNRNFNEYIEDHVLTGKGHLFWFMEETDLLFSRPDLYTDFFQLLRSWANEGQARSHSLWRALSLIIAYATEVHLVIQNLNASPFNIGETFDLKDFTLQELADLNQRYGSPLQSAGELAQFHHLVGGHPYLTRRGLAMLAQKPMSLADFASSASRDDGPMGRHLHRLLLLLHRRPENVAAVREVLAEKPCPANTFYDLRSSGVLSGEDADTARFRCHLYFLFLQRHL
jgi:hypothetical protein